MEEKIVIHGNPNGSVFGLIGNDTSTDEGKFYVKVSDDSKNKGWREIPPTPTPTQTVSITPSKTPIVTRTPTPNPTVFPTATPTISITPTITPSGAPGTTRTPTPTPTYTSFRTIINYTIVANGNGTVERTDGPSPTGTIANNGVAVMYLQATPADGYHLQGWTASEGVLFSNPYSLGPEAYGFYTLADVVMTANFAPGLLPTFRINAIANSRGVVIFNYVNSVGEEIEFIEGGFPPGATLVGLACGHVVTSGNAYITSTTC
jgi:hypothetical protein